MSVYSGITPAFKNRSRNRGLGIKRPTEVALGLLVFFAACGGAQKTVSPRTPSRQVVVAPGKATTQLPENLVIDGQMIGKRVQSRGSEICLVCGKPIGKDDVVSMIHGYQVALHAAECYGAFDKPPWKYLAFIAPHGAFLGRGGEGRALSLGWFFLGLYVLLGLVFAAMSAHQAIHAGRSPMVWFAAGLVVNAVGYLVLITRPRIEAWAPGGVPTGLRKIPATYSPRACPGCGSSNHPSATECAGCGANLQPSVVSEVRKAGL